MSSRSKKQSRPPKLGPVEEKLLLTKVRQIEQKMSDPTKMKIYDRIKSDVRWQRHRPDVLQKGIAISMLTKEPKKKRKRNKNKSNNMPSKPSKLEHINNAERKETFDHDTTKNDKSKNTIKNDRKRKYNEISSDKETKTVFIDSTEGKRGLLKHVNNPKAREELDEIIKDKLSEKHGKKRRKMNNTMNNDPIVSASNTSWELTYPQETLSSVGGTQQIDDKLKDLIVSMKCNVWKFLGVSPPRSVLLYGPPGSGKTLLAHAIAGECQIGLIKVSAPELVAGLSGQSEAKIRSLFEAAIVNEPCVVFIDEIDVIANKRENAQRQMESRIVAQLLTCLDEIARQSMEKRVLFIAATNRPNSIDNALRRGDRFDYELTMGIPDQSARFKILKIITKNMKLEEEFDYESIAESTNGFVGADLKALTKTAGIIGVKRILKELDPFYDKDQDNEKEKESTPNYDRVELNEMQMKAHCIKYDDFTNALEFVEPSSRREGFATIPDVSWDDIGALEDIRKELTIKIICRIKKRKLFEQMDINEACGVLLYGPPGCGKTLLAKGIAAASGASFISIKGPELLNKYVGESEKAIRTVFERARTSTPCIIFFDELDALAPKRESGESSNNVSSRVVNQLLTELDGVKDRGEIFVIGATNRYDIIDTALIRPGRLGTKIYIGLPNKKDRHKILIAQTRNKPLKKDVNLKQIAENKKCQRFSGADLYCLVKEAAMNVIRRKLENEYQNDSDNDDNNENDEKLEISHKDFLKALEIVKPSINELQAKEYQLMAKMSQNL